MEDNTSLRRDRKRVKEKKRGREGYKREGKRRVERLREREGGSRGKEMEGVEGWEREAARQEQQVFSLTCAAHLTSTPIRQSEN